MIVTATQAFKRGYFIFCGGITLGIISVVWSWTIALLVFFAAELLFTWAELMVAQYYKVERGN